MKTKKRKQKGGWKTGIQTFGRSLLLPIAVLAPIGMLMGICGALSQQYMIEKLPFLDHAVLQSIIVSLQTVTSMIFNNIPLLFAMGVAYGMSKNEKGIAVFASVVSYLTLNVTMGTYLKLTGTLADPETMSQVGQGMVLGIQTLKIEAAGGIICGLLAAKTADRFYKVELPLAFAFFGGKKSVPILSFILSIPLGFVIPVVWGILTRLLISVSFIFMNDYVGHGIYWIMHRALIPFGLHHVLASIVRFTEAGGTYMIHGQQYVGILPAVNEILFNLGPSDPAWAEWMPKLTSYLDSGQMLNTLFRVPAIGLAMYRTSFAKNRKVAKGVILTVVLTAFLGNITEPLEFSFLFIAPQLFVIYCLLCGLLSLPLGFLNISIGYIRGTIFDFGIFGMLYDHTNWINLVLLGAVNFAVFYVVFKWAIERFDLETPGREKFEVSESASMLLKEKRYPEIAAIVVEQLGGKSNIVKVENCISRLRVDLADQEKVNQECLKDSGCAGFFFPQKNHIHVVFGPHVEFVRNALDELMKK